MEGIKLTESLKTDLMCPVCLRIPDEFPIYQCVRGHIHCKECRPRVKDCPVCRGKLPKDNRCLLAELMIARLILPCEFAKFGCTTELTKDQLKEHQQNCGFQPRKCLIPHCNERHSIVSFLDHISTHYKNFKIRKSENCETLTIRLNKLKKISEAKNYYQILKHLSFGDQNFIVQMKVMEKDGTVQVVPRFLGTEEEAAKYRLHIRIFNPRENVELSCKSIAEPLIKDPEPVLSISRGQIEMLSSVGKTFRAEFRLECNENTLDDTGNAESEKSDVSDDEEISSVEEPFTKRKRLESNEIVIGQSPNPDRSHSVVDLDASVITPPISIHNNSTISLDSSLDNSLGFLDSPR